VQAHLAQKARVAHALQGAGLRVAVDCSLCHAGASWRELRSLAKQLQLCVGANKKAPAPLNLHFVGVTGESRGLESMVHGRQQEGSGAADFAFCGGI
jgi:hypothetical protein